MDYKEAIAKYCAEARADGATCRDAQVEILISISSDQWSASYSDAELVVASRIRYEFSQEIS